MLRGRRLQRFYGTAVCNDLARTLNSLEQPREAIAWTLLSRLSLYRLEPYARRLVIEQLEAGGLEHGDDCGQRARRKRLFSRLEVANRTGWDAGAAA